MLFRLVRPVKRKGSRHHKYVRRIPSGPKGRVAGLKLAIPSRLRSSLFVLLSQVGRAPCLGGACGQLIAGEESGPLAA